MRYDLTCSGDEFSAALPTRRGQPVTRRGEEQGEQLSPWLCRDEPTCAAVIVEDVKREALCLRDRPFRLRERERSSLKDECLRRLYLIKAGRIG